MGEGVRGETSGLKISPARAGRLRHLDLGVLVHQMAQIRRPAPLSAYDKKWSADALMASDHTPSDRAKPKRASATRRRQSRGR